MAEGRVDDIVVRPLTRALLDGVDDGPAEGGDGSAGGEPRSVDLMVLPCFADERPLQGLAGLVDWRAGGMLSNLLREGFFVGHAGEAMLLPGRRTLPMRRIVLLGLGRVGELDRAAALAAGARLVDVVDRIDPDDVLVAMPGRVPDRAVVEAVFEGLTRALTLATDEPDVQARPAARVVGDDAAVRLDGSDAETERGEPGGGRRPEIAAAPDDGVVALEPVVDGVEASASGAEAIGASGASPRPAGLAEVSHERGVDGSPTPREAAVPVERATRGRRRWWVVADPRHEARLRRLLEGPPRAAQARSS